MTLNVFTGTKADSGGVSPGATVVAVVVTYFPVVDVLHDLLESLSQQCFRIIIVDNTPSDILTRNFFFENVEIVTLKDNFGIAYALNVGIRRAQELSADFVLLSDQDSLPAPDMVHKLLDVYSLLVKNEVRVGVLGPSFSNIHNGKVYPFKVLKPGSFFCSSEYPSENQDYIEALTVITSGSIIPISVISDVGGMWNELFIDNVDLEWCLRAGYKGYKIIGVRQATMYQRMGDSALKFWFFGWIHASAYNPLRIYYQVRNLLAMRNLIFVGCRWWILKLYHTVGVLGLNLLFGTNRIKIILMAGRGVVDGLRGKLGRYCGRE